MYKGAVVRRDRYSVPGTSSSRADIRSTSSDPRAFGIRWRWRTPALHDGLHASGPLNTRAPAEINHALVNINQASLEINQSNNKHHLTNHGVNRVDVFHRLLNPSNWKCYLWTCRRGNGFAAAGRSHCRGIYSDFTTGKFPMSLSTVEWSSRTKWQHSNCLNGCLNPYTRTHLLYPIGLPDPLTLTNRLP